MQCEGRVQWLRLITFSAGIFLVHAIEAYSDKVYRAHFSETHNLDVTKPGVDPCDVRNDVEDLTKTAQASARR